MIEAVIDHLNTNFETLSYMTGNTHNLCRRAQKTSDNVKKTYPAVINAKLENCNVDKEVYVLPDRKKKAVVWWETIGQSRHEEINSRLETVTIPVRMYVWLNSDLINKQDMNTGSYMGDLFSLLPKQLPKIDDIYQIFLQNIRFKQNGDDFRVFSFDAMFTTKPYICLSVDMELMMFVNRGCYPLVTVKDYDECGGEIS